MKLRITDYELLNSRPAYPGGCRGAVSAPIPLGRETLPLHEKKRCHCELNRSDPSQDGARHIQSFVGVSRRRRGEGGKNLPARLVLRAGVSRPAFLAKRDTRGFPPQEAQPHLLLSPLEGERIKERGCAGNLRLSIFEFRV